ncbi:MAG: 30S ribosomal protein S12 methylthiotransferase RimO [Candidatus Riflebacteria bacterium]|nr:30S ribosomal protein S12 methylthiotransferase RimO [Candidatus Riflebacteria bacterium]
MKFHLISLGCSKNTADSEQVANGFATRGWQWANQPEQADLLLINTCGFINDAKEESLRVIMEALSFKKQRPEMKAAVFGCLVKRYHSEIQAQIPEIDFLFEFLTEDQLEQLVNLNKKRCTTPDYNKSWRFFTPPHTGILKIAEGCSNRCSYCAIPGIRGPFFSRPEDEILQDARRLADSGAREISIVAQDITRYGTEKEGKCQLPALIGKVAQIRGIEWIRLHYMHPRGLTGKLLDELYHIDKVLPYFDIPFQHISNHILEAMNRHTTPEHIKRLIEHIRNKFPESAIRTTFIVGFPGEKKRDFEELIEFIEEYPLDRVGAFAYSTEEGTAAADFRPKVSKPVKQARLDQLMTLQQLIIEERNRRLIGKELQVIIDSISDNSALARTRFDAFEVDNSTTITDCGKLKAGDFTRVRITEADAYDFKAELVE